MRYFDPGRVGPYVPLPRKTVGAAKNEFGQIGRRDRARPRHQNVRSGVIAVGPVGLSLNLG